MGPTQNGPLPFPPLDGLPVWVCTGHAPTTTVCYFRVWPCPGPCTSNSGVAIPHECAPAHLALCCCLMILHARCPSTLRPHVTICSVQPPSPRPRGIAAQTLSTAVAVTACLGAQRPEAARGASGTRQQWAGPDQHELARVPCACPPHDRLDIPSPLARVSHTVKQENKREEDDSRAAAAGDKLEHRRAETARASECTHHTSW